MSSSNTLRLLPVFPSSRLGEAASARGARCFVVRHPGSPADGEVLVAAPQASGLRQILVPRGLGRPMMARRGSQGPRRGGEGELAGWQIEGSGESCSGRRWVAVGGLAARIRAIDLPRGPVQALEPAARLAPPQGVVPLWLVVRVVAPAWSIVRRRDASVARGPVVLTRAGDLVAAVSPEASVEGIVAGMSLRLARRRCPSLRSAPHPGGPAVAELSAELLGLFDSELGEAARIAGPAGGLSFRVALPDLRPGEALAVAERVMIRAWQESGVHLRAALCADLDTAVAMSRLLDSDTLALVPGSAAAVWRRRRAATRAQQGRVQAARGTLDVSGEGLTDVEGIVALARQAVSSARGPGVLLLRTTDSVQRIRVPDGPAAPFVETALRRLAPRLGSVVGVRWEPACLSAAEQMALPMLRRARG